MVTEGIQDGFIRIQLPQARVLLHKPSLLKYLPSGEEEGPRAGLKVWTYFTHDIINTDSTLWWTEYAKTNTYSEFHSG